MMGAGREFYPRASLLCSALTQDREWSQRILEKDGLIKKGT